MGLSGYHRVQRSGILRQKVRGYIRKDCIRRPLLFVVAPGTSGSVFPPTSIRMDDVILVLLCGGRRAIENIERHALTQKQSERPFKSFVLQANTTTAPIADTSTLCV